MNNRAFTVGGALALASALVLAPVAGSPAHAGVQQVNAPAVVAPAEISAEGAAHACGYCRNGTPNWSSCHL